MIKKELHISALCTSESSPDNYALILEEPKSKVRVPIIIGAFEAQSIAVHFERMKIPRPLTYDLFKNTIESLHATVKEIIIHNLIDNVFHAWLILGNGKNDEIKIDARASDAIAIGIRFDCPIFMYDFVLDEASVAESEKRLSLLKGSLAHYSDEALKDLLEDLLRKEDYESAARIRDMIEKRLK
ncbi:MAG TPA: bifunctional nuclease domain-containing protein [Arachidicoccus sp.]